MNHPRTNFYPLHRSGCTLKRDSWIDPNRIYGPVQLFGSETIILFCGFEWDGIKDIPANFQLFTVDAEFDYNSFYSLN